MLAVTLLIGCQLPYQISPLGEPWAVVNVGNLKFERNASLAIVLKFENDQLATQALESHGVYRVQVSVTSPSLAEPLIKEVTQPDFQAGKAVFNFGNIPPGKVTVKVNAYDANGDLIQWANGEADIVPNQTSTLSLYCNTATGNLEVVYDCPDCPSPTPSSTPTPTPTPTPIPSPGFATASTLVDGRYNHSTEIIGNFIYLLGGQNSSGYLNSVERAEILPDGTISAFSDAGVPELAKMRAGLDTIVIGNYIYAMGAYGSSNDRSVERAEISSDGSIGAFSVVPGVTLKTSSTAHSIVRIGNYLYVLGGYIYSGQNKNGVDRAVINPDNTISDFTAVAGVTLPEARTYSATNIIGNYLYVIGGSSTGSNALSTVARATIDQTTGNISTFSNVATLSQPRLGPTSFVKDGFLYVVGGRPSLSTVTTSIERAPINADGTIGEFSVFPGASLQVGRGHHTSVLLGNFLYVTGGYNPNLNPTALSSTEISAF